MSGKVHIIGSLGSLCGCIETREYISLGAYITAEYYRGLAAPPPYFCKNCLKAYEHIQAQERTI